MFKELDPLLHSQLRLAIISILLSVEEAEFVFLKERTGASSGNLSLQLEKLKKSGYIDIRKSYKKRYPVTICKITTPGIEAFERYVAAIKQYLKLK